MQSVKNIFYLLTLITSGIFILQNYTNIMETEYEYGEFKVYERHFRALQTHKFSSRSFSQRFPRFF